MTTDLPAWLDAEYVKARTAARTAAVGNAEVRELEGLKAASRRSHFHVSAVARMCAFGEVLQLLDLPIPAEGENR